MAPLVTREGDLRSSIIKELFKYKTRYKDSDRASDLKNERGSEIQIV